MVIFMKALKFIGKMLLTLIFVALVVVVIIVLSYTLSSPSTTGESRQIITGPWDQLAESTDGDAWEFYFSQDGTFKIYEISSADVIADGYFKVDEDDESDGTGTIKLFMIPGHYTDEFSKYVNYKCLAEISYVDLQCELNDKDEIDEDNVPTVKLLINEAGSDGITDQFNCQMNEVTIDLYNSEYDLTKDA